MFEQSYPSYRKCSTTFLCFISITSNGKISILNENMFYLWHAWLNVNVKTNGVVYSYFFVAWTYMFQTIMIDGCVYGWVIKVY